MLNGGMAISAYGHELVGPSRPTSCANYQCVYDPCLSAGLAGSFLSIRHVSLASSRSWPPDYRAIS